MKNIYILLLTVLFAASNAQSQCTAPAINSFSPETGFIGSTITISGAYFDAIPANNIVYFGATKATVLTASFGTLTVTAPIGATTALISVTNACKLTAYSKIPFNGLFCQTPINASTYNNTIFTLNGISGAYNMLTQDMDLDGKPDIVSCFNGLTVARNTSTPGNITFVAHNFSGGGSHVATADFDGDGKKDIMTANNIYRNTSTGPGNINFSITGGFGGYQGNVGDFNNDGKIDIIAGTNLYRNTSTGPGNISFVFAGSVANGATGIQCADLDGDGKTDIMGTEGGNNRAFTYRNVTAQGAATFVFETVEYWPSIGLYPYRCQIADFDKDGRIDLCTPTYSSATNTQNTTIWRNTSVIGNISFGVASNYPGPNGNYRIAVGDVDGDGYPDIVTKSIGLASFDVYRNISSGPGNVNFASRFTYPDLTGEVSGITIGDLDADFVPDIATSGINSNSIRIHKNTSSQVDNTPPSAMCKNITVALSPTGSVVVTAAMIDNGSSDACGIGSIKINDNASVTFTCANIGANSVTLKVTDRAGNISTCTATVNVAPAVIIVAGQTTVCQGQTVLLNANLGDTYQWQKDGVDISGATSQTYTATVSGNYTVSVTNAGGCSGTSSATAITVNNNPTVNTIPAAGNVSLCPPGNLTISASTSSIYQWKLNGNNISGATQQNYTATGLGSYSVQVIDLFGCSATSSPVVIASVTDNIPPTAICKNATVVINSSGTASITVANINNGSFDNCSGVIVSIPSGEKTTYTCADAGKSFQVTLLVTDAAGNTSTCSATVLVTDPNTVCNQPPVAVCKAITVSANANCQGNAIATDFNNGSSDPDAGDVLTYSVSPAGPYAIGVTNVTLTVTDSKGASSTCNTTVTVVDDQLPVLVGVPANTTVECNAVPSVPVVTATDNCSTSAPSFTETRTNGNCASRYTLTRTWSTTDASGNTTTASQVITVQDTQAPVLSAAPIDATVSCNAIPAAAILTASDNCDNAPAVTYNQISTQNTNPNSAGFYNYVITRTWTAKDACGNVSSKTQTITVQDKTAPTAVCKPVTVTLVGSTASVTAASVNNGSSDNCGGPVTLSVSPSTFNCANIGANTVILTVTDASGNSSTCTTIVNVVGEIPTCSIASIPNSSVFTGGVSTNLYLGYGATATTLQVSVPSSGAPYTYSWSGVGLSNTSTANPVFTPTTAGVYNFTVTTTNKYGCSTTCTISICVTDIRVLDKKGLPSGKVYICHIPPGNPSNPNTLEISVNAVSAHIGLHGGDRLGSCNTVPCAGSVAPQVSANSTLSFTIDKTTVASEEELKVTVMPNPTSTFFTLKLESKYDIPVNMIVVDASGRVVDSKSKLGSNSTIEVGHNYASGTYFAEMIQGIKRKVVQLIKGN